MSLALVDAVREAEAQAEALKKDATAQVRQISAENQKACALVLEKAQNRAKAQRNDAILAVDAAAEQEGQKRRATVREQCEAITKAASTKTDSAVGIVFERIVKG